MERPTDDSARLESASNQQEMSDRLRQIHDFCRSRTITLRDALHFLKNANVKNLVAAGALRTYTLPQEYYDKQKHSPQQRVIGENLFAFIKERNLAEHVRMPKNVQFVEKRTLPKLSESAIVTVDDIAHCIGASLSRARALVKHGFMPRRAGLGGSDVVSARIFVRFLFLGLGWNADEIELRTGWNRAEIAERISLTISNSVGTPKIKHQSRRPSDRRKAQ